MQTGPIPRKKPEIPPKESLYPPERGSRFPETGPETPEQVPKQAPDPMNSPKSGLYKPFLRSSCMPLFFPYILSY